MTLSTHIVIAAAVTKPFLYANPILGFLAGLASHYLSDAIPHWDYSLRSLSADTPAEKRKFSSKTDFLFDVKKMAFDAMLGCAVVLLIMRPSSFSEYFALSLAVIGGTLPDFLQGLYYTRKMEFLEPLQKFHDRIHTKIKLGPYPLLGIPLQLIFFLSALAFLL